MIKLIVADCTPSVFSVVEAAFPETEFKIFTFSDGHKMMSELATIQPDVILMNLFLDSKDGYDVCRLLNSQDHFKATPLFLFKGAFERIDEERIKGLEYHELIEEPFDSKELLRKVRDVLGGGLDPQTLPEEPMPAGTVSIEMELEDKINSLIAEHLQKSEDRIVARLKADGRECLKKEDKD